MCLTESQHSSKFQASQLNTSQASKFQASQQGRWTYFISGRDVIKIYGHIRITYNVLASPSNVCVCVYVCV